MSRTMIVATDGQAVIRTHDEGKNWYRINIGQDLEYDDRVRCLLIDPADPTALYAGAEKGLFYSSDHGVHWSKVDCALNDFAVWKLVASESDPKVMYAGTGAPSRSILFRSRDGGRSWERTKLEMPEFCAGVNRPRMLALAVDPDDENDVWAGVEEGGLYRSRDGGDTWKRIDTGWSEFGGDDGETWTRLSAKDSFGLRYSRLLMRKPGSNRDVAVGIGDGTPGTTAAILTSGDAGLTWTQADLDSPSNSCMWAFGGNAADPDFMLAGSKFGYLYRSTDAGKSWTKEWREFNEITDITWIPGVPEDLGLPHVTK